MDNECIAGTSLQATNPFYTEKATMDKVKENANKAFSAGLGKVGQFLRSNRIDNAFRHYNTNASSRKIAHFFFFVLRTGWKSRRLGNGDCSSGCLVLVRKSRQWKSLFQRGPTAVEFQERTTSREKLISAPLDE